MVKVIEFLTREHVVRGARSRLRCQPTCVRALNMAAKMKAPVFALRDGSLWVMELTEVESTGSA